MEAGAGATSATTAPASSHREVDIGSLAAKVAFLREPAVYPDRPAAVEVVETHKSWVFLTREFAWKLKKPIRYNSVDFRALESRRLDCLNEVRLNRRLAPEIYLGVVPLTRDVAGRLALGGSGAPVEWLVQMRRLPAERMLDELIERQAVDEQDIRAVAHRLATFYRGLAPEEMAGAVYRQRLRRDIRANARELSQAAIQMPAEAVHAIHARQLRFLDTEAGMLDQRARDGRIVEGHGDLRPAHICLLERDTIIFDCLEFDRDLRIVDAVDELAFLAMECRRIGAAFAGPLLFEVYRQVTHDIPPERLVRFYTSYRAGIWARLAMLRTHELPPERWGKWLDRARDYLGIAAEAARDFGDAG